MKLSPRLKNWMRDLAILIVFLLGVAWWQGRHLLPSGAPIDLQLNVETLDGTQLPLAAVLKKDSNALLYFWAPWCGVCGVTIDNALRAQRWAGADQQGQIALIALHYGSLDDVLAFVQEHQLPPEAVYLADDHLGQHFAITAFPSFYFLRNAQVLAKGMGYSTTLGLWFRYIFY